MIQKSLTTHHLMILKVKLDKMFQIKVTELLKEYLK